MTLYKMRFSRLVTTVFVVAAVSAACGSSTNRTAAPPSTSERLTQPTNLAHPASTKPATTSTSFFGGPTRSERVRQLLEDSLQAARFLDIGNGPDDYRLVTAAGLQGKVAQTTYGPIAQAGMDAVGFAVESATRIVFVVQETSYQWDCVAIDDVGGIASPKFGSSPTRDAISTVNGCFSQA
ncbi:MAG: hypothetical protein JWM72_4497 [Actinomycetia bacterium]|nr:hypothetical protein [Actinomycetes bacterium]